MPTHQQKLDFIRQACNKANPALMELKFGCEVWANIRLADAEGEKRRVKFVIVSDRMYDEDLVLARIQGNWETIHLEKKHVSEILGRLPSLADILLAMEMKVDISWIRKGLCFEYGFGDDKKWCCWNLLLPFDQQDEVAISFIFELLK